MNVTDLWRVRHALPPIDDAAGYPPLARAIEVVAPLPLVLVVASCLSLVARYRRSGPVERLQLRWLFTAVAGLAVGMVGFMASGGPSGASGVLRVLVLAGMSGIPVAIGVAVLRYRLYELDRIVSRARTYAVVTALLAGVYVAGVVGVGAVVPTGASDLLVATTTLVVAALFAPVGATGAVGRRPPLPSGALRRLARGRGVRRAAAGRGRPRGGPVGAPGHRRGGRARFHDLPLDPAAPRRGPIRGGGSCADRRASADDPACQARLVATGSVGVGSGAAGVSSPKRSWARR